MPQRSVVHRYEDYVLVQYEKHLELWKLGETNKRAELESKQDGESLPINRSPRKYLHLRSKRDMQIVCSSLGSDAASTKQNVEYLWLAYSDLNVIHIYKLEISSPTKNLPSNDPPKISVDKIKSLPLACANRPAVLMKFHLHSQDKLLRLVYLTNKSCLQSLKLANYETGFVLESTIQCLPQELLLTENRVYSLAVRDDLVSTVDTDRNLIVWSVKSQQQVCVLPVYSHLVTAMGFHSKHDLLLVAYSDRKVIKDLMI